MSNNATIPTSKKDNYNTNNYTPKFRLIRGIVKGLVQGVGFRAFTRRVATELRLVGWVKNNYDGSVEFEAFGPKDNIDKFLETIKIGPRLAQVESIEILSDSLTEDKCTYKCIDFSIRY